MYIDDNEAIVNPNDGVYLVIGVTCKWDCYEMLLLSFTCRKFFVLCWLGKNSYFCLKVFTDAWKDCVGDTYKMYTEKHSTQVLKF